MKLRLCLIVAKLLSLAMPARGQFFQKLDDWFRQQQEKQPYDTTYIYRPQERWLVRTRSRINGESLRLVVGADNGTSYGAAVSNGGEFYQSIGLGYRKLALNVQFHPFGQKTSFGYDFNVYGNRIGFNHHAGISYGMTGVAIEGSELTDIPANGIVCFNTSASAYYAFNGKRFSMPAAINQNFVQRKSAGSILATMQAQAFSLGFPNAASSGIPVQNVSVAIFGLGGGYGYNWVPSERWLIHLSLTETLGFLKSSWLTFNGEETLRHPGGPPVFMTRGHAAVLYYFGKWYTGITVDADDLLCLSGDDTMGYYLGRMNSNAFLSLGVRF